jgi:catechol 2,3-dioxygenase-like lactoylglutathione lyase family enzyme
MRCKRWVPLITVQDLAASVAFFVDRLGFHTVFRSDGYVSLRHPQADLQLAFMRPLPDETPFRGHGLTYGLEVDDVDAEYDRIRTQGVDTDGPPRDNPWGDRSFTVVDPSGIALHIHQVIEPAPEYAGYFVHEHPPHHETR